MPKFKIEYNFGTVKDTMTALGVNKIFQPGVGDFSRMFTKVSQNLCVGSIIHKAVIDVDEKGTEAAAATAIMMMACCAPLPRRDIKVTLDKPFAFWLATKDGIISFAGLCYDPEPRER